jgi:SAM-dependent methyltransferase
VNKIQEPSEYDSFARFYDLFFGQKDDDLAMYRDFALAADGDVLELGCGTGRLLVPLAQVGYHVTGLDVSRPMLDVAAGKIAQAGLQERVELVQGSLDDFDLQSRFSLIIIPINTFMHCYDLEQQLACLRCVRRHLLPGGQLVIDVFHPDFQSLLECDGRVVSEGTLVDPD